MNVNFSELRLSCVSPDKNHHHRYTVYTQCAGINRGDAFNKLLQHVRNCLTLARLLTHRARFYFKIFSFPAKQFDVMNNTRKLCLYTKINCNMFVSSFVWHAILRCCGLGFVYNNYLIYIIIVITLEHAVKREPKTDRNYDALARVYYRKLTSSIRPR